MEVSFVVVVGSRRNAQRESLPAYLYSAFGDSRRTPVASRDSGLECTLTLYSRPLPLFTGLSALGLIVTKAH